MNELTPSPSCAITYESAPEPLNILAVISRAAADPSVDVDKMERLLAMAERTEVRQAEKDFAAALVRLQGETVRVAATKKVDAKADGTCRYKFAPYEEIMAVVQPMLTRHGFSITFDTEVGDNRLTSMCTLTHSGGHSRQNRFAVRYGKPPGSSDAQGDMSTKSYAKRGALCDALNIAIDHDDDARNESAATITEDEAKELARRVNACGADQSKFLAFAGAATFAEIPANKLQSLLDMLARKEREKAKAEPAKDWSKEPDLL